MPPAEGSYEIRDRLLPSVRSWVVVTSKLVKCVYPTRKGDFATELEPGAYTLKAFFSGANVGDPLSITVKDGKDFQLPDPLKAGKDPEKKTDDKKDDKKTDDKKGG